MHTTRQIFVLMLAALAWLVLGLLTFSTTATVNAQTTGTPTITATATATPAATPIPIYGTVYQTTNLRSGADTRFEIVGRLSRDDRVQVIGREGDAGRWLYVMDAINPATGATGWMPAFSVSLEGGLTPLDVPIYVDPDELPAADGDVVVIAYGRVNVRSGPTISFDIVAQLDVEDQAQATARSNNSNDWLYIVHESGVEGWVAYFTVNVTGDTDTLPILVPDSAGESLVSPSFVLRSRFNVRLRIEPSLDAADVAVVPFNSRVTLLARSEDSTWLYVDYDGIEGWGAAELFSAPPTGESVPVFTLDMATEAVSEGTAEATLEASPEAVIEATPEIDAP